MKKNYVDGLNIILVIGLFLVSFLFISGCMTGMFGADVNSVAVIDTDKGVIKIELYEKRAPITTGNFINLTSQGFYDAIRFHRVIHGFMIQGGDPNSRMDNEAYWGTGGPGYTINDEFHAELKHDSEGILSMANAGPNTGGSQFFITEGPQPHLDGKHAVFGKVISGMDVVKAIEKGDYIKSIEIE